MVAIGLGKHRGATAFHSCGLDRVGELLPQLGRVVLAKAPILFGLANLENAYDRPARFEIVWNEDMIIWEKELLVEARALMPRVIPGNLDVLIVHEIGKEISGSGMDSNITGRSSSPYFKRENSLKVQRIVILNLSKATGGSAMGIGLADFTTDKVVQSMSLDTTWINCITAGVTASGKIPPRAHGSCGYPAGPQDLRPIEASAEPHRVDSKHAFPRADLGVEPLLPEIEGHPHLEIAGEAVPMPFDEQGNLLY